MPTYSVAEAKANLSALIDQAVAGEDVTITRHGKPVVDMRAKTVQGEANLDWLRARRDARPTVKTSAVDLIQQMYDKE